MHRNVRFPILLVVLVVVVVSFGKPSPVSAQGDPTFFGMLDVLFQILDVHRMNDGVHVAFDIKEANGPEDLGYTKVFISVDPVVDMELENAISISLAALGADAGWSWGPSSPYAITTLHWVHTPGNVLTVSDLELIAELNGFEITPNTAGDVPPGIESTAWMPPMQKSWFTEFSLHTVDWGTVETFTLVHIQERLNQEGFSLGNVPTDIHTGSQVAPFPAEPIEGMDVAVGPTPLAHSGGMVATKEVGPTILTIGIVLALIVMICCAGALALLPKGNGQMRQTHS